MTLGIILCSVVVPVLELVAVWQLDGAQRRHGKMLPGVSPGPLTYTLAVLTAVDALITDSRSRPAGEKARDGRNLSKPG